MAKRSFITGAGGFIGANLARRLLAEGDEVHVFVRPAKTNWRLIGLEDKITVHEGDMRSYESVQAALQVAKPERVFHLAGYGASGTEKDSDQIREVNITGTHHLYRVCSEIGGVEVIIHAGSAAEYGKKQESLREDMLPEPSTEYGLAKLWATQYGEILRREKNVPITTLRLFNTYGPYDVGVRLSAAVTLALLRGDVPQLSNPEVVRDFVYIDDVVGAFLKATDAPFGVYNVGTGIQTSLREVVALIQKEVGSNKELVWGGDPGRGTDSSFFMADTTKAEHGLGWKATTPLTDGMQKSVAWLSDHQESYA